MYIIAEVGSNFESLAHLKRSIEIAKECGASAVKFQHFTAHELFGHGSKVMLCEDWIWALKVKSQEVGIQFSVTMFDPSKLQRFADLFDFIKIPSSNMMDLRLLNVAKQFPDHRVFISTGGHTLEEIERVYRYMPRADFLYCESAYPSYVNNYRKMDVIPFTGVSDHSLELFPNYPTATQIVEKHVNLVGVESTPDANHALGPISFKRYCDYLADPSKVPFQLSLEEHSMRTRHNVRFVARRYIKQGELFTWDNLGVFRGTKESESYINPMDEGLVIGKKAARNIDYWETIGLRDIQAAQR